MQMDSFGNYEVIVNGTRFSGQENSAKRDPGYKLSIGYISLQMVSAFERRDAEFTAMHKKAARMQKPAEHQKKIENMYPQRYERETFPLSRPMREDVRKELEQEAAIRFVDLYEDKRKERTSFVNEHVEDAMATRLRAYEEIQSFFSDLQDDKEVRTNTIFQKEYERQRKEIEDFINGEQKSTEDRIRTILVELNLPYRIEISCDYSQKNGLLDTEIEFYGDMHLPTTKTNILASGKISVKDKLVKELELFKTETIVSMIYYIAASLFNAAINIRTQRVSVWLDGKREGMIWIQFDRSNFSKLSMRTVNPMLNYYDWPRVDALRMVRGALQFDTMDAVSFKNAIKQTMAENDIVDAFVTIPNRELSTSGWTVTIGYAQALAKILPEDYDLQAVVLEALQANTSKLTLPNRYKGISKEPNG